MLLSPSPTCRSLPLSLDQILSEYVPCTLPLAVIKQRAKKLIGIIIVRGRHVPFWRTRRSHFNHLVCAHPVSFFFVPFQNISLTQLSSWVFPKFLDVLVCSHPAQLTNPNFNVSLGFQKREGVDMNTLIKLTTFYELNVSGTITTSSRMFRS